jgi:hypothetical protein
MNKKKANSKVTSVKDIEKKYFPNYVTNKTNKVRNNQISDFVITNDISAILKNGIVLK